MKKLVLTTLGITTITLLFGQPLNTPPIPANFREYNPNYMKTILFDDFQGSMLDPTKWYPSVGAKENQFNIFENDPLYVKVEDGNLKLIARSTPNVLASWTNGAGQTITETRNYTSGEITSNLKYGYGSYECRCMFPNAINTCMAFWSYGGDGIPCSLGGNFASEIDFAELKNTNNNPYLDFVFHGWVHPDPCGTSSEYDLSANNLIKSNSISLNNWHMFKAVWTPYSVKFYIDGVEKWKRTRFSLSGNDVDIENLYSWLSYSEHGWFPHFLQQIVLSNQVIGSSLSNPPITAYFDYVRVKEFFLAPEITISNSNCLTSTATMDVASEATNVTWQLTPSSLFTTTNGNGKIANISKASFAQGLGKITYTFQMPQPSGETFTANKDIWVGNPGIVYISGAQHVNQSGTNEIYEAIMQDDAETTYEWWVNPSCTVTSYGKSATINFPADGDYRVYVKATNTCGESTQELFVAVGEYEPYIIFPNPVDEIITLQMNATGTTLTNSSVTEKLKKSDIYEIKVLNEQGTVMKTQKANHLPLNIQTSNLPEGKYIFQVLNNGKSWNKQLLIKH